MTRCRRAAAALAALLLGVTAEAQDSLRLNVHEGRGPVEIRADSLAASRGEGGERVEAAGSVELLWQGYRLTAQRASFDRRTSVAEAEEDVTLADEAGNLLHCERLAVNVETQEGTVEEGSLTIAREGYRVWGKRFQKTGPVTYRVEDGGFTACDGTWPSWRVEASRIEVELEGYLKSRHAVFWAEGVPVLYTPYLLFPVKRQRQAGFLLPKLGLSSRDGAVLATRYYWPFADSADVTARLEYRSLRGWTEAAELRYALAEGHEGVAEASHLFDRKDDSHRYTVKADHWSRFDEVTRARLHVDYLGDKGYLTDFGDTLDQRGTDRLESFALATRDQEPGTWYGYAQYIQALQQPQGPVLQTLPSLGLFGKETPLGGGFALASTASVTRYFRVQGIDGEVISLDPSLSWGTELGGLGLAARAGYLQNLYRLDSEFESAGAGRAEASASVALARKYGSLVHTVEPRLTYRWHEKARVQDSPDFDTVDTFESTAEVDVLVESRILRAPDLSPLAALDLEGGLDAGRLRRDGLVGRAALPVRGRLSLTPWGDLEARAEGVYDPSVRDPWLSWSLGAQDRDARGDRAFASYHYLKGSAAYGDGGLELALTPSLALQYRRRQSFRDGRVLEESVGLHLGHPCWEILASFSRNYREEDELFEQRYYLALQLKGLGKLGTLRGVLP